MPNPKPKEKQADFMNRCIPELIKEGRPKAQAAAICNAKFEAHINKKEKK